MQKSWLKAAMLTAALLLCFTGCGQNAPISAGQPPESPLYTGIGKRSCGKLYLGRGFGHHQRSQINGCGRIKMAKKKGRRMTCKRFRTMSWS